MTLRTVFVVVSALGGCFLFLLAGAGALADLPNTGIYRSTSGFWRLAVNGRDVTQGVVWIVAGLVWVAFGAYMVWNKVTS